MQIAIVGAGYVGLTTGAALASIGHRITCVDVRPERIAEIEAGRVPFYEPGLDRLLAEGLSSGRLRCTTNLDAAVSTAAAIFIAVGTPDHDGAIDLSQVVAAAERIGDAMRQTTGYQVVVVKSTVTPGTTDGVVRQALETHSGRPLGEFGLCMNPEFLREGSAVSDFLHPDRIVIGESDQAAGHVLGEVYETFDCPKIVTTPRNAEMIKYASNTLLATLVSFSNEIAAICEVTPGTSVDVVLRGVQLDRRWSPRVDGVTVSPGILAFLQAGCGFGGSCLPKDLNALRTYARSRGAAPVLLDAAEQVNARRASQVLRLAADAVGTWRGRTIAVLGVAFKPGTDDSRHSPALAIVGELRAAGATVRVYDPMATPPVEWKADGAIVPCQNIDDAVNAADAAIVVTAWPEFSGADWAALSRRMRSAVIVDLRRALHDIVWPPSVRYITVGQSPDRVS